MATVRQPAILSNDGIRQEVRVTEQEAAVAEAERLHGLATKGPWEYRPNQRDDWGVVRNDAGYYVLQARDGGATSADEHNAHRAAGTDPYAPNALSAAALHNVAPALFAAWRREKKLWEIVRLYVDPMNVRPEHEAIVSAALSTEER